VDRAVLEALATGAVPVILDGGGPVDIVHREVRYRVPATDVVSGMAEVLSNLAADRELLSRVRYQGVSYAKECLTLELVSKPPQSDKRGCEDE